MDVITCLSSYLCFRMHVWCHAWGELDKWMGVIHEIIRETIPTLHRKRSSVACRKDSSLSTYKLNTCAASRKGHFPIAASRKGGTCENKVQGSWPFHWLVRWVQIPNAAQHADWAIKLAEVSNEVRQVMVWLQANDPYTRDHECVCARPQKQTCLEN